MKEKTYVCQALNTDGIRVFNSSMEDTIIATVGKIDGDGVMGVNVYLGGKTLKEFAYVLINFYNEADMDGVSWDFPCAVIPTDKITVTAFGEDMLVLYSNHHSVFLNRKQCLKLGSKLLRVYARSV